MPSQLPAFDEFEPLFCAGGAVLVPMVRRLLSDTLTPVTAYRRLVRPDARLAPSFLFESVVDGSRVGRYSFLGARPAMEVIARGHRVELRDHREPGRSRSFDSDDPLAEMDRITGGVGLAGDGAAFPGAGGGGVRPDFTGGWVGYAGYDTVRYLEGDKLASPPPDDRGLPDLHMQLYIDVVAFDHVQKTLLLITHVRCDEHDDAAAGYAAGVERLDALAERLLHGDDPPLPGRHVPLKAAAPTLPTSNLGEGGYQRAVEACKRYIGAGDAFQIVPSQRFELRTKADPFDVYRALRVVNPSPYMFYLQVDGAVLVGSSPEILVRVKGGVATSRPLAGTRRRGATPEEDRALEEELKADPKDRAEHIMLVDLHRNDIGRIAAPGSVELHGLMHVERYSHVMHLSSEVRGKLREGLTAWDALRVSLPVGTVSGAPKVRAMQIIDELEAARRGPYGGAVGYADFAGDMDTCIALRTMVMMPAEAGGDRGSGIGVQQERKSTAASSGSPEPRTPNPEPFWTVHLQAGGGIVADSDPDAEHEETVNKAAALARAVELAEMMFVA